MVKEIIENRNALLEATGYFEKVYGLCKLKQDGEKTVPSCYIGKEYKPVQIDKKNGICYWRLEGKPAFEDSKDLKAVSCDEFLKYDVPLKLVCFIPTKKLKTDDAYSGMRVSRTLVKNISGNVSGILSAVNAAKSTADILDTNLDSVEIIEEEYGDPDIPDIPYKFLAISLSVNFSFHIPASCIVAECD